MKTGTTTKVNGLNETIKRLQALKAKRFDDTCDLCGAMRDNKIHNVKTKRLILCRSHRLSLHN